MSKRIPLAAVAVLLAAPAAALQPLDDFLRGARTANPDLGEARAAREEGAAQAQVALGRVLPRVSLRGAYTRNQAETTLELPGPGGAVASVVVTPRDQLDGTAALDVPLVDPSGFARVAAARTGATASATQATSADLRVQSVVAQDYYRLAGALALVGAARRALDVARASLRIADERRAAGAAPLLDADRARAEVERNVQQVASAELDVSLLARALRSATGIEPALEGEARLADDLHEEPPLERFQPPDEQIPAVAAAMQARAASEQQATAQRLALVPSLGATVAERATNEPGLAGRDASWQAVVGLTWTFDLTTIATIRAQDAAAEGARAREQRARLAARDDIHRAWMSVRTDLARSRSARAQAEVSARAAGLALDRYQAGAAAQLDLLQAQRDAYDAAAARIQADADLVNARAQLRLAAGQSLLGRAAGGAP